MPGPADLSLYYFAGDFVDVLERFSAGRAQIYRTHDEVAAMIVELVGDGLKLRVTSFVTPAPAIRHPRDGVEVIDLGAAGWGDRGLLKEAVTRDDARKIVAGFPNTELLRAVRRSPARAFAVLASSYNERGWRARLRTARLVRLLNDDRFEWVSNHGLPSTMQLARMGVRTDKLVPWDIPHELSPDRYPAKQLRADASEPRAVYVGTILEAKGVPDLVRAVALLRSRGIELRSTFLGEGEVEAMRALAASMGVDDLVEFLGVVDNVEAQRYMRDADVVVVPSRHEYPEGFPLTIYEAIASRTPLVCSDHPMFVHHLIDGVTASTFRGGRADSLAAALERTLGDPELYARLSEAAPATLASLAGSGDYRSMIREWAHSDGPSEWLTERALNRRSA